MAFYAHGYQLQYPDRGDYAISGIQYHRWREQFLDAEYRWTLAIRGNGEFTKFQRVKVDGTVIDASNYTVTEGSTIITFKADYPKSLSEGSHTFELVWTDGSASTSFTVARDASGNDTDDDDESDDKDSNGNSNNGGSGNADSGNSANGGGNAVQNLTKSPNTGDSSVVWMTLFAVSLAGFAGMLIYKKKERR